MGYRFDSKIFSVSGHRLLIQAGRRLVFLCFGLITVALIACTTLPRPEIRPLTLAYEPHPQRRLAVIAENLLKGTETGTSGFSMLLRNDKALRWRLLLADLAEETLDIQVFIWKNDASSDLLLDRVIKAADRGVRVRILVDDIHLIGGDRAVAALNQHSQIEVRLFNPAKGRSGSSILYGIEFLGNVKQLNQRMHNKLTVADNRFAICRRPEYRQRVFRIEFRTQFYRF